MKKRILAIFFAALMAVMAMPITAQAAPTPVPLTEARAQRLTDFFAQFGGWFGVAPALGDYDVNSPDSIYAALEFVLSSRVFSHGRAGILLYPHYGFVQYKGGQRFRTFEEVPGGAMFEFITADHVDSVLWSFFGITGFDHGASEFTPTFGFQYHAGGYYYRALAQGSAEPVEIAIAALYDNGNGTYSVVIEYILLGWDWELSIPEHLQYNIAVIQPFADTYQLLYWRNDVPRNAQIPVRQPLQQATSIRLQIGSVNYTVNGQPRQMDAPSFIADDRTMVPIRLVAEALGAEVEWVSATRTAVIRLGGATVYLVLDVPLAGGMGTPVIVNDHTFVPIGFVAEALGASVRWDGSARAVYIVQ